MLDIVKKMSNWCLALTLPYTTPELKVPKARQFEMADIAVKDIPPAPNSTAGKKSTLSAKSTPFNPANAISMSTPSMPAATTNFSARFPKV